MEIYVEYAISENFCMDFTLLTTAKFLTKNGAGYARICISSTIGACFAVIFPLLRLSGIFAIAIKIFSGIAMCLIGGKFNSVKKFVIFTTAFFAATFLCGGAIIALFTLLKTDYEIGNGYIISSVPIGIPLFVAVIIAIIIKKISKRLQKYNTKEFKCKFFLKDKTAICKGFIDSGNNVYLNGKPITIVPFHVAARLIDVGGIKTTTKIHTVAGQSEIKVFAADRIEITDGEKIIRKSNIMLGVAAKYTSKAVLHADISEQ